MHYIIVLVNAQDVYETKDNGLRIFVDKRNRNSLKNAFLGIKLSYINHSQIFIMNIKKICKRDITNSRSSHLCCMIKVSENE